MQCSPSLFLSLPLSVCLSLYTMQPPICVFVCLCLPIHTKQYIVFIVHCTGIDSSPTFLMSPTGMPLPLLWIISSSCVLLSISYMNIIELTSHIIVLFYVLWGLKNMCLPHTKNTSCSLFKKKMGIFLVSHPFSSLDKLYILIRLIKNLLKNAENSNIKKKSAM